MRFVNGFTFVWYGAFFQTGVTLSFRISPPLSFFFLPELFNSESGVSRFAFFVQTCDFKINECLRFVLALAALRVCYDTWYDSRA